MATGMGGQADTGAAGRPLGGEPERHTEDVRRSTPPDAIKQAPRGTHILVVHDDSGGRPTLIDGLGACSVSVSGVSVRGDIPSAVSRAEPDLILILLNPAIAQRDGLGLLRDIRSRSDAPIVVKTHQEGDEVDRIVALELGADDYLDRPVSLRELLARIHALLRRCERARNSARRPPERGGFRFAGWQVHRRSRRLVTPGGTVVPVTKGEYALLIAFLSAPQRPLSREQLLQATRVHEDVFDRSIDVQVLRLRRKLEIDPAVPRFIQTERGVGYSFALPVESY